ncbi:peptidoglycan-binding domain-containing protein [Phytopseudomonas dryadis]|uniref:Peptidoglycan binding-like domain-containing protein n=1 Tax=Phytopseudomonas dryadis TaxID=2487520 RepID=A0A4Q9QTT1_9GAMM|nr:MULTISPECIES: peptidoglycan-binding domain-containing protein [Pseudomonas]TBU86560.1 hypothetical protein DNK44_22680 [Pseudomonas dryadis]TBV07242.1 hypothetical protein DNK34_08385 [Pseudomonas dryadis]TBV13421.1 hypothetical protein DNK41_22430 [Pseudomonas sp. FRB 230]
MRYYTLLGSLAIMLSGCALQPSASVPDSAATTPAPTAPQPAAPAEQAVVPGVAFVAPSGEALNSAPAIAGLDSRHEPEEHEIQAGQCWVYAQVKPRPVQSTLDVVVKDSVNKITVTPAELQKGFTQVVTREGAKTYRIEPPTYREVTEQVMIRPELKRYVVVPAVYRERQQTVVLEEAKTVLDPCRTAGTGYARGTGVMAFCAREVPAREEVVKVQELVSPETVRVETEPAEYKSVKRWVIDKPAQAVEVILDPEVTQLAMSEISRPVEANQVILPEKKKQLQVTRFEGKARIVSRQTVCEGDIDKELVTRLQHSLARRGFDPGRADGLLGKRTIGALSEFQAANGLAIGALTLESLTVLELD